MAQKKLYIGSLGPYFYDDAVALDDPDGDFAGEDHQAIVSDGQILLETAPVLNEEVVRLVDLVGLVNARILAPLVVADIDTPDAELNAVDSTAGAIVLAYEVEANADQYTLYAWDSANAAGVDSRSCRAPVSWWMVQRVGLI